MQILDARTLPPPVRHPGILRTFDELPGGGRFVLVNDHYPKPLLYQFLAERRGQFEWSVLQSGPELYRVEIGKRAEPGPSGVSDYLQTDHARLDAIAARLANALDSGDLAAARASSDELACGLERHMRAEEQVLFPAFERVTGMVGGPVAVMNEEHATLRELLARIRDGIDGGTAREALEEALDLLEEHNAKEEHVIYPRTDHALGDREREELVVKMLTL